MNEVTRARLKLFGAILLVILLAHVLIITLIMKHHPAPVEESPVGTEQAATAAAVQTAVPASSATAPVPVKVKRSPASGRGSSAAAKRSRLPSRLRPLPRRRSTAIRNRPAIQISKNRSILRRRFTATCRPVRSSAAPEPLPASWSILPPAMCCGRKIRQPRFRSLQWSR